MKMIRAIFVLTLFFAANVRAGQPPVFFEKFNNNMNNWSIDDNSNYYSAIQDGKYFIRHKSKYIQLFTTDAFSLKGRDTFTIEAVITKKSGSDDAKYGLVFGFKGKGKKNKKIDKNVYAYVLRISDNGEGVLDSIRKGEWEKPIIGGKLENTVRPNSANKFTVVHDGLLTHFFLNDIYLRGIPALKMNGDLIGVANEKNIVMEVDSLKVYDGIPKYWERLITQARLMQTDSGAVFHGMKILPYEVKAKKLFGFEVDFTVFDSSKQNEQVDVELSYAVVKGKKTLFEKTVQLKSEVNKSYTFLKKGLIAGKRKGNFQLRITVRYGDKETVITQPFEVI